MDAGPLGLGRQFFTINKRRRILHSSKTQSTSNICYSALVSFLSYLQLHVIHVFYVSYCGRLVSSIYVFNVKSTNWDHKFSNLTSQKAILSILPLYLTKHPISVVLF